MCWAWAVAISTQKSANLFSENQIKYEICTGRVIFHLENYESVLYYVSWLGRQLMILNYCPFDYFSFSCYKTLNVKDALFMIY